MNVQRKVAIPLATAGALLLAVGGFLGTEAAAGAGLFHATVAPAATSATLSPSPTATASDTPAPSPAAAAPTTDTQTVTAPTSSSTTTTTAAAPAATTTQAPAPVAVTPPTNITSGPGFSGGQPGQQGGGAGVAPNVAPKPRCAPGMEAVQDANGAWVCRTVPAATSSNG